MNALVQPVKHPRRRRAGGLALVAALAVPILCAPGGDALREGFVSPPPEARLRCYWWWLNGNTTQAAITRDLEQMKAKGYGGALLVDADGSSQQGNNPAPAGPMFGSPAWRALYLHALGEAHRLGLEISLNILSGWNLGGPDVTPAEGAKTLAWARVAVEGPAEIERELPQPESLRGFYRDIAVLAYPLRHGAALPGGRRPIRQLAIKTASQEFGMSMPQTAPLLEDFPATEGEEDAGVGEVRDVTASMAAGGQFAWRVPAGSWEILRIGYAASGARVSTSSQTWQGLAIDYMDRGALEAYWTRNVAPLLEAARPYLGRTLRYLVTDSWELGGINWTGKFRQEFRQRRGYDPLPYLPVVAGRMVGSRDASNRFLNDFRRTIGDLIVSEHYAAFARLAAGYGLGIHPESGGPHGAPLDALETLGVSAFPQTEYWAPSATLRTGDSERFFVKEASSAAHIYGKTLVAAEGMTSIGPQWEESPASLKPAFDTAVCEGMNRLVWHTFTSSPREMGLPGQEYFAGTHLNPNVTWWPRAGAFTGYMNRAQFLMQQGQPVSDVLYYYGDHVPNFVRLKSADPAGVLPGYDYDVTDERVLTGRLRVGDGLIALPEGVTYRLLVLPELPSVSVEALRAVRKLVADGAVVLGGKPQRATGLAGDDEVRAIAAEVWGDCGRNGVTARRFGKGSLHCGGTAREALAALGVLPDFEGAGLDYVHRQAAGADIYFVRNTRPEAVSEDVVLRSKGKAPELWHPEDGRTEPQAVYQFTADGRTRMPLRLGPFGSVFVVLRRAAGEHIVRASWTGNAAPGAEARLREDGTVDLETSAAGSYRATLQSGATLGAEVAAVGEVRAVEGPWSLSFPPGWGAPAKIGLDRLASWTESADPGIRYFSGTATYAARFRLPERLDAAEPLYLDLGEVREIAEVRVNGRNLGILWKQPFRVALGAAARPGWNELEVEVTNLWPNRLIGDQHVAPEGRLTRTNIAKFNADSPLLSSGLLGPVTVVAARVVRMVKVD
jgi:hypothetical protein